MSKGILLLAQNSEYDYVKQAYLNAMSIRLTNPNTKVSIVTNDTVPEKYKKYFDKIIDIPWQDDAKDKEWKIENRWKLYHVTPYQETIVLDTDMLVLQDISEWWNFLENYDLYFVSDVYTYRGDKIVSDYYRKTFTSNNLPNVYAGFHYFKKSDLAQEFYYLLELIVNNWELFYGNFVSKNYPKRCSIDVSSALAIKILGIGNRVTNSRSKIPTFTHMKSKIQDWKFYNENWLQRIPVYMTPDAKLKIGNYLQNGIFHYTEKEFVTEEIIQIYEEILDD